MWKKYKTQTAYNLRQLAKSFVSQLSWPWFVPAASLIAGIPIWITLANNSNLRNDVLEFVLSFTQRIENMHLQQVYVFALVVVVLAYLYIDYRQHSKPLKKDFPDAAYSLFHHTRLVVLPRMAYNSKRSIYAFVYGLAGLFVISAVTSLILATQQTYAAGGAPFITTWKTDITGAPNQNQVTFPISHWYDEEYPATYTIDWGDGNTSTDYLDNPTHTYTAPGTYTVKFVTNINAPYFRIGNTDDKRKLLSVEQWGSLNWRFMENSFADATNVVINASDAPDLTSVTSLNRMFSGATSFNQSIDHWDVSTITKMAGVFSNTT